jgi:lysophospholipase L1-like esterase
VSYARYVALGDSTTEGLEDRYADGSGWCGFADRLAGRLAELNPDLGYANLAIRGRLARQIRAEQLEPALALQPDVASVIGGLNDILRPRVDLDAVAGHVDAMIGALRAAGAEVLTLTYPDPAAIIPLARGARGRTLAHNENVREICVRRGARLADLERRGVADPRLWAPDRLHANPEGHARIAAAMAQALDLPGADDAWADPLPPAGPGPRAHLLVMREAAWFGRHMAPWVVRRVRGRSSGDGRTAKRPTLGPVLPLVREDAG